MEDGFCGAPVAGPPAFPLQPRPDPVRPPSWWPGWPTGWPSRPPRPPPARRDSADPRAGGTGGPDGFRCPSTGRRPRPRRPWRLSPTSTGPNSGLGRPSSSRMVDAGGRAVGCPPPADGERPVDVAGVFLRTSPGPRWPVLGCGLRPPKFEHRNGADSSGLACVPGKAWVAPRLLGVDAVAFSAGQFADGHRCMSRFRVRHCRHRRRSGCSTSPGWWVLLPWLRRRR